MMPLLRLLRGSNGFGYKPDQPDPRDRSIADLLGLEPPAALPLTASVRHPDVLPKVQSGTNSCTGQAWAQALRLAYLARGIPCPDLSALFNYFLGRAVWGGEAMDAGSLLRTGAKALARFGCASESAWAFDRFRVNTKPPWRAFRDAFDRGRLQGYYRVSSPDDVRRAIAAGHPVVGGWFVDKAFADYSGPVIVASLDGEPAGGHAMCVVGYDADGNFELINSWGAGYRDGGYVRITEALMARVIDAWAAEIT